MCVERYTLYTQLRPSLRSMRHRPVCAARLSRSLHTRASASPAAAAGRRLPGRLVGLGSACVDLLAAVDKYPAPDAKIRTQNLTVTGGGNTANQLTAAARLGPWLHPKLWTKLGDDAYGQQICSDLEADNVDTTHVLHQQGCASPFTYIIVDLADKTRTCIHTPGPATAASELGADAVASLLADAALCMFDGRLAEVALVLAQAASERGIPCLVEAERPREGLEAVLSCATTVVTSATFPGTWTGHAQLHDALMAAWARLPGAQIVVTTLGSEGSIALHRCPASGQAQAPVDAAGLATLLQQLRAATAHAAPPPPRGSQPRPRNSVSSPPVLLAMRDDAGITSQQWGRLIYTPAAVVHPDDIVDTTGAGDAFIGSLAYGLVDGLPLERSLALASWVAAHRCRLPGPRPGLPRREEVPEMLLKLD